MYICMVAYMGAVGILLERVVSACSAYLVNCVYSRVSICIYAWLPIWKLCGLGNNRYICMVAYMSAVGILPDRVVSACSAYLVNCVYRVSICIYAWLPIWAL
jgi:hypothetical protein